MPPKPKNQNEPGTNEGEQTDAGNGSKAICRVSNALRSPSPDPGRWPPLAVNTTNFHLVPVSQLGEEHFAQHPVWSELYDFEERDEIASWGIDRQWLDEQIRGNDIGNEHWAYPVLMPQPLPARMRIYISATFTALSGDRLRGFVINSDAYCVTIFASGEQFTFSRHPAIADLSYRSLDQLSRAVPDIHAIFPLQYHTHFRDEDGGPIQGTFYLPERKVPNDTQISDAHRRHPGVQP